MEYFNVMDEKNRFVKLKIYDNGKTGQFDSHTMSYLEMRKQLKALGYVMGFDRPMDKSEKPTNRAYLVGNWSDW